MKQNRRREEKSKLKNVKISKKEKRERVKKWKIKKRGETRSETVYH